MRIAHIINNIYRLYKKALANEYLLSVSAFLHYYIYYDMDFFISSSSESTSLSSVTVRSTCPWEKMIPLPLPPAMQNQPHGLHPGH